MNHRNTRNVALIFTLCFCLVSCGAVVAPLSVAATGITPSSVLDKLEQKVTNIIGQAAGAASLVSSKAARDVQLLISATRQELHDELGENWDRLDSQKLSILRSIDDSLNRLGQAVQQGGKIEDAIFLDIESLLTKLPFSKETPSIRRVAGPPNIFVTWARTES
jgi:hypothetical protein